tara:strand:+ start:766 stop:891 length:126 start_codon:yes stop_codon:yes gene_type:complete
MSRYFCPFFGADLAEGGMGYGLGRLILRHFDFSSKVGFVLL